MSDDTDGLALSLPPFTLWLPAGFQVLYGRVSALTPPLRAAVDTVPVARGVPAALGQGAHGPVVVHAALAGSPGLFDAAGARRALRALTGGGWFRAPTWQAGEVQPFVLDGETALRMTLHAPRAPWAAVGVLLPAGLAMGVVQYACHPADLDTWAPRFAGWAARTQGVSRDLGSRAGALGYEHALTRAARRRPAAQA